ncbi:MAG: 6-phosphogluconolactonase [Acidobacteriota bacterium]|nr:6-phosphogluconolactonase [Acidobacteriota bacterium]
MSHRIDICPDAETMAARAAAAIAESLRAARARREVAHLALSGGTTPVRTYRLLARAPRDLERTELWFADERCVGPQDPESNHRLVRETIAAPAHLPAEALHRMEGELGPHPGALRYAEQLREGVPPAPGSEIPALDLIVLGIGPDGHIASLFPGHPALDAPPGALCLGVTDSPKPPPERITLTLHVINHANRCLLLASGESKAGALAGALGEPTSAAPASLLNPDRLHVIADRAAGALLPEYA